MLLCCFIRPRQCLITILWRNSYFWPCGQGREHELASGFYCTRMYMKTGMCLVIDIIQHYTVLSQLLCSISMVLKLFLSFPLLEAGEFPHPTCPQHYRGGPILNYRTFWSCFIHFSFIMKHLTLWTVMIPREMVHAAKYMSMPRCQKNV